MSESDSEDGVGTITAVDGSHAKVLAAMHATSFPPEECWSANVIALQLGAPGSFGLADSRGGMILCRSTGDEGEVLTLAVDPMRRREGIGADLMNAAMTHAAGSGVARMFLEVSVENTTAIGLYRRMGFETVGGRRRYYADGTDALVMRADLHPG